MKTDRAKYKLPPRAEELPALPELCRMVNSVLKLDHMMTCVRTEIAHEFPEPPRPYKWGPEVEKETKELLSSLSNSFSRICFRLNDSLTNERERLMVENYAPLAYLEKWLPPIRPDNVIRIPFPEKMDHLDYLFLMGECMGYEDSFSRLKDYLFFENEENRDKFRQYMWDKYPHTRT